MVSFVFVDFCFVFFSIFMIFIFYFLVFFLSFKDLSLVKVSSFESGFLSLVKIQNSFSIHFFVIMLMFVIFDLEVVMFLGLLISDFSSLCVFFLLFVFVLGGFYMEWSYGKLIWMV
uniref:NADH-ubiquinone oxidoreductase chain 3 n=1 Tax=Parafilaroides normani TaxID=1519083 RepID=A0A075QX93_PARNR|nr:NADH dehydrogenase subunit 3 [Parafilaroides normani]AIG23799.1 NADH dehydrogenase subunit 3 [Parafilaroides normani]